ncbi:MFS transporter [Patescibacteria group bacterium]|nr:MFS transporter [Patescibacteria group bacterium]MBU1672870.1 MFS transporter [Patescibacteria group bacterium]MBU1963121.1 MFS transporter [Patescibacteria group bacterium]
MKRPLKVILGTNALVILAGALLTPIWAIYVEGIGGDILTAGFAYAIFLIVAGVVIVVFGKLEDKIKRKDLVVVVSYAIMGVGFFCYLLVKSPWQLFIVQAIIGLGEAIYIPALNALYDRFIEEKKAASQWGSWDGMIYIVAGVAAISGAVIADYLGFSMLFIAMGCFCLLSALGMLILPKNKFQKWSKRKS